MELVQELVGALVAVCHERELLLLRLLRLLLRLRLLVVEERRCSRAVLLLGAQRGPIGWVARCAVPLARPGAALEV